MKPVKLKNGMCTCKSPEKDCPLKTKSQYYCTRDELVKAGIPVEDIEDKGINNG